MKNIKYLFFLVLLISPFSYGQTGVEDFKDPEPLNYESFIYQTTNEVLSDYFNQILLSYFGNEALIASMPINTSDNIINDLDKLNNQEAIDNIFASEGITNSFIQDFSLKEGNDLSIMGSILQISIYIGYFILAVFIVWNVLESILEGQFSGSFLGSNFSGGKIVGRFVVVSLLITPIGSSSLVYYTFFKGVGYSNLVTKNMNEFYVNYSPSFVPVVGLPNFDSKSQSMSELMYFGICLYNKGVEANQVGTANITLETENNVDFYSTTQIKGCEINISFSLDDETNSLFEENGVLEEYAINYNEAQKSLIVSSLNQVVSQASLYGKRFAESYYKIKNVYSRSIAENIITSVKGNPYEIDRNSCSGLENRPIRDESELTNFVNTAVACLSNTIVTDLSYPKDFDYNSVFGGDSYLNKGKVEACGYQPAPRNKDINRSIILNSGELYVTDDSEYVVRDANIENCLKNYCSSIEGNSYLCGVNANLLASIKNKEKMAKKGWLIAGASIYSSFGDVQISSSPKVLLNSISISSSYYNAKSTFDSKDNVSEYPQTLNASGPFIQVPVFALSEEDNGELGAINGINSPLSAYLFIKNINQNSVLDQAQTLLAENLNFGVDGKAGIFGTKELFECVRNPISYESGFACGTPANEVAKFGDNLFRYVIHYYLYKSVATIGRAVDSSGEDGSLGGKIDESKEISGITGDVFSMLKEYTVFYSSFAIGESVLSGAELNSNDAYLSSSNYKNNELVAAIIPVIERMSIIETGGIGGAISKTVMFALLISIICLFVIPLMPFAIFLAAIINYFYRLFIAVVFINAWLASLLSARQNTTTGLGKRGLLMIIQVFMMPPLYFSGLVVAWILSAELMSTVITHSDVFSALAIDSSDYVTGMIDSLVSIFFYIVILYVIYSVIFSIIEGLNEMASEWIFSRAAANPFASKDRSGHWESYSGIGNSVLNKFKWK